MNCRQLNNQARAAHGFKVFVSVAIITRTEAAAHLLKLIQSGKSLKASNASVHTERWVPFLFDMPP
jgi:hypothetical protein